MIIGEVWQSNTVAAEYINADELDMTFNFDLAQNILTALNNQVAGPVEYGLDKSLQLAPQEKYGTFLTNHDQARTMSQLFSSVDKARVAATILLTLPGTPFIYYGEEIGMTGNKPDERIRTPMQWSSEANAGFSSASPWEALNDDYTSVNVSLEASDATSLLAHYRALVNLRNQHAALRVGEYLAVDCDQSGLLTFLRISQDEVVLVVVNLGKQPVKGYNLSMTSSPLSGDYSAVPLFVGSLSGDTRFSVPVVDAQGGFTQYSPVPEIPAYGTVILVFR
jgi:glycosidase